MRAIYQKNVYFGCTMKLNRHVRTWTEENVTRPRTVFLYSFLKSTYSTRHITSGASRETPDSTIESLGARINIIDMQ